MKKEQLSKLSTKEKVCFLMILISSLFVVILAALGLLGIFPIAITNMIMFPVMGADMIFRCGCIL